MIEVLTEKGLKVSLENGLLAVSPKQLISDDLRIFIRQNKTELITELKRQKLEKFLSLNNEMREQFEFEVSKRFADMMFAGKHSEIEAVTLSQNYTFQIWATLFIE